MERGELYRAGPMGNDPRRWRVYVVVSRQEFINTRYSTVVCAPVYSAHHGLATQVVIGEAEGLKRPSSIHCDGLLSVPKSELRHFVGSLGATKRTELNRALQVALDLREDEG